MSLCTTLHGRSGKGPRTLAEELRDIGEEFIEFLEQGLQALEGNAPKERQRAPSDSTGDSSSASSAAGSTTRCEALCPSIVFWRLSASLQINRWSCNATSLAGVPKRLQKHKLVRLQRRQLNRQSRHSFKLSKERQLLRMK